MNLVRHTTEHTGLVVPCARRSRAVRVCAWLAIAASLAGCRLDGLQLQADDRLRFRSPASMEEADVPLTISWAMDDFQAVGLDGSREAGRGAFAVFLDHTPMAPGKSLRSVVANDDDPACQRDPECPTLEYLSKRGIYVTTETEVVIDVLPTNDRDGDDDDHYVYVVLVDGTGHRSGESAWYRTFTSRNPRR